MKRIISSKEDNIFQDYYDLIASAKLKGEDEWVDLEEMKGLISNLENNLEKTLFRKKEFWNTPFYRLMHLGLIKFLASFEIIGIEYRVLYVAFIKYIRYLIYLSKNSANVSTEETYENFNQFIPSSEFISEINPELEFEVHPPASYQSIAKFELRLRVKLGLVENSNGKIYSIDSNTLTVFCDKYKAVKLIWDVKKDIYVSTEKLYYMTVELIYYKGSKTIAKPDEFALSFYLITSSLSKINGLSIEVLDIKKGSIQAKLRLWMSNLASKQETQNLFKNAKRTVSPNHGKAHLKKTGLAQVQSEIEFLAENEQNSTEDYQNTQNPEDYLSKEQISRIVDNEIEKDRLTNEALRLQNVKASLEIVKMSQEIVGQGLSTPEDIELIINHSLFFKKSEGAIVENNVDIRKIS